MAHMMRKGLTSQISQEFMETTQPLLPAIYTSSSSMVHLNQQQVEDGVRIDIEKRKQDNPHCIYRVPRMIRKLNEDAYTPMAVSIGPFHYGDERLQDMEEYKQVLFERFMQKAEASMADKMDSIVKNSEPEVRASYSENIKLDSEVFTKLVLVDAVFIIELFTSIYNKEIQNDPKLSQPYLLGTIFNDLILLENQLPFFLIENLFNALPQRRDLRSFLHLTFEFFGHFKKQKPSPDSINRILHFTDLLRLFYLPKEKHPNKPPPKRECFVGKTLLHYSANELREVGIKLKPIESDSLFSESLFDFEFSGHVLKISQIFVEDTTEFLLRNVIALEQCHYPGESYIIDYALAMDCLIDTDKDVEVLVHNNIIHNWLGDAHEAATLFNGLCKNIFPSTCSCHYLKIFRELNEFYQNPWCKMKATLRHDYCNTPWKTAGTAVGIIILILTTTQTIISLLGTL